EDSLTIKFGLREAEFRPDGFYLNGEKIKLRGLNRHQMYPYIGIAAPKRLQRKDADIIKYELGCNIVRTSHYPQSPHFLDRCDEIGLLVFEEPPGWQFIGDSDWKALVLRDVQAMIERDRNHPSIILWGVRINESWDDDALYRATNELAHQLDPTRPTGGVRYFQESTFLEDVFTFNDFSNTIVAPQHTPHLVTEYGGHMFPTKSFDNEERQVEHALRHARIQNAAAGRDDVTGAIGWCAFDYNTHVEFGSGDRVCYHGVMDMFRLPKYAAYFYGSQIDPKERIVLFAATSWQLGDIDTGVPDEIWVFSNCDEVEIFVGDNPQGRFKPNHDRFPNLPHPPFMAKQIEARIAHGHDDLMVVGYLNGEVVAEQRIAMDGIPHTLQLVLDDEELVADGSDMTRVVVRITDEYGNPLRYSFTPITFEIEGPAQLVGENPLALVGGQAALLVRAGQEAGAVTITASAPRLGSASASLNTVAG
ncbi:MAG: glycoside hydrolase family 2 protein, partial [Anaerolineae bacterium]|nr:glycoside hydrolase family 2 protein [Anaerolineae bacterium]